MDRPVTIRDLIPVLAETMRFATQALAQQTALLVVLSEKGIVTKAELDAEMKRNPPATKTLLDLLGTFSPDAPKPS